MKKNQKGFGVLEALLILVIVSIVGGVSWFVWQKQRASTNTADQVKTESNSQDQEASSEDFSYKLPEDWGEISCGVENSETNPLYHLASPNDDKAKDCDDRANTVLIAVQPQDEAYSKCQTTAQINEYKKSKPVNHYECQEILINDVRTLVTTADYGGGLQVSYEFKGSSPLSMTYYGDSKGELPHKDKIAELANSVKFN